MWHQSLASGFVAYVLLAGLSRAIAFRVGWGLSLCFFGRVTNVLRLALALMQDPRTRRGLLLKDRRIIVELENLKPAFSSGEGPMLMINDVGRLNSRPIEPTPFLLATFDLCAAWLKWQVAVWSYADWIWTSNSET